jgi:predicted HTH transcriptional regulator
MIEMSDADLLSRLTNCEDHMVERKTVADMNDSLKTVVAFANSAPIGYPCVLYIGAANDGSFEIRQHDFDSVQMKLNRMLEKIYPRVYYISKVLTQGSNRVLAVTVPGSPDRPHFSGPSFVRRGSETREASAEQFDALIAERTAKQRHHHAWRVGCRSHPRGLQPVLAHPAKPRSTATMLHSPRC